MSADPFATPQPAWPCGRCGWSCEHVECGGIYHCPNCGVPRDVPGRPGFVTYAGGLGCQFCDGRYARRRAAVAAQEGAVRARVEMLERELTLARAELRRLGRAQAGEAP